MIVLFDVSWAIVLSRLLDEASKEWSSEASNRNKKTEKDNDHDDDEEEEYPEHSERVCQLVDDRGRGLVHAAALGGSLDCLRLVLFAGADPFSADALDGRTPLHLATIAHTVLNSSQLSADEGDLTEISHSDFLNRTQNIHSNLLSSSAEIALVLLKVGVVNVYFDVW